MIIGTLPKCELESQNKFTNNSAGGSGGAIFWDYNEPANVKNPSYSGNTANQYGNDYGWFAQVLKTITETEYDSLNSPQRRYSLYMSKRI